MSGQIRDIKPKTGQMGARGELWFFRNTSLKIWTVLENPGRMVSLVWTPPSFCVRRIPYVFSYPSPFSRRDRVNYTVSQKYHCFVLLYLWHIRTDFVNLWQKCYREKCNQKSLFSDLTCASALPGETGKPEIASIHLNAACSFANKNRKHTKISPATPSLSKRLTVCTRQDVAKE